MIDIVLLSNTQNQPEFSTMKSEVLLVMWALFSVTLSAGLIDLSHKHGPETLMFANSPNFNRSDIFLGEFLPGVL